MVGENTRVVNSLIFPQSPTKTPYFEPIYHEKSVKDAFFEGNFERFDLLRFP
jgi:hypothetical protein